VERKLVLRGLLAGLAGGLAAFVVARILVEPQIQAAIDDESGRDAAERVLDRAAGLPVGDGEREVFSRAVQANAGLGIGVVLFGVAMGLLFAFVYTFCLGRVGRLRPRTLSVLVAGAGFGALYLVPSLKYPANPPAIGKGETIWDRGNLYLLMVGCSVLLGVGAVVLGRWLRPRFGSWNATLLAAGTYAVVIGVVMALLPTFGDLSANVAGHGHRATETPLPLTDAGGRIVYPGFPADTLAAFRLYSVLAQAVLWTTIGLVFAPLAERLLAPAPDPATSPPPVRSVPS